MSGSLPATCDDLAQVLGIHRDAVGAALTPRVMKAFESSHEGRLICPELEALRTEYVAKRTERSKSGRRGAHSRWSESRKSMAEPMAEPSALAIATPEMRRAEVRREELKGTAPLGRVR